MRESVLQSAQSLISLIRDADRRLADRQIDANNQIAQSVAEVNTIVQNIAQLNSQIFRSEAGGTGDLSSALRDRRSELLNDLAQHVDFSYFERPDGQIAAFLSGGGMLVDSEVAGGLAAQPGAGGNPVFLDVFHELQGSLSGPVTSTIRGGTLGAAIDLRDNRLQSYRDSLDEFAFTLARRINNEHYGPLPAPPPGDAFGLVDNVSRRFFVDGTAAAVPEGADFALIGGAASRIAIHTDIATDTRHIAAGATSVGGSGAAAGDNENALEMAARQLDSSAFFQISLPRVT